jgi:PAS domain S-box-containing protein
MSRDPADRTTASLRFLEGGGEMGRLLRAHDWAATSLGAPEGWPQSLRTAMRLLLNTGHPMYIFWGPEGLCFYNDAYRPSLGAEMHPSSIGRPARAVWAEIWHAIGGQIAQVMRGDGATWNENHLIPMTRDGVRGDVYWTYSYGPIDDDEAENGVGGVLVVCTETTQQIALATQLARSQERLRLALSGGRGIGIWDWDVQADRVVADEQFARLYNVDPAKAKAGAPIAEFFAAMHPDDVERVRGRVAEALRFGDLFSEEYRLVAPNGRVCWVLAEGRCEMSADGTPLRFPGVSFDISDRKSIEQQLRVLNADLERKVVERALERGRTWQVSPEMLGVINEEGHFETSNPAWHTVLGWTEEEVASRIFFDFIHPDDLPKTQAAWADATERGLPALRFENRYVRKDGGYRWLSWVAVPEGGKVYCSARDVTEDKEREEALRQTEGALRQSQKMEAVGQLTGGLAHDFNNLLAGISGSLEVVEKSVATGRLDKVDRFLLLARGAVRRAAALTHRLLAFSRRQTLDPKPTDVNRLVTGMEELVRRTMGPAVHVEVVGAGGLWPTLVDPSQLENALLNLCINARDAMPDGGRLTIETANKWLDDRAARERDLPPGQYVSLCVTDTGVGMAPEVVAKAFDPFFTTKPIGTGTGLGLSMTYGFARQSGGQVRIYSEPGKGTTVCVYLPRHHAEAAVESAPAPDPVAGAVDGEVVLVIDDEPVVRSLIVDLLEGSGYRVLEAADGPGGLRVLEAAGRLDLLITDVGLPGGLNGRQVADAARASRPGLKVLFITGYAENAVVGNGHVERWMSVVTKPFEMDVLARRIRDILAS